MRGGILAVLFDLDGTLIDSAPDLVAATNDLMARLGRPPLPYERLRPHAGSGARGMLGEALGLSPQDAGYEDLRSTFYAHYETRLMEQTCIYAAVGPVLDALDRHGVPWGIVTNKASRFAEPSAQRLGLLPRTRALVCGDTTAHTKPHPEPLHEAARRLGLPSTACVYVGDDPRDIQAGRAAGMSTLAVAWGYLGPGAQPTDWGADAVLDHPDRLLHWLDLP